MNSEYNWKNDPRLNNMSKEKLDYITSFAERLGKMPKSQLMSTFLTMQAETSQKGIRFNDQETDLLVSVLSANMSPEERKRLDTLRMVAKNLAARSS